MTTRTKPKATKKPALVRKKPAKGRAKGEIKNSGIRDPAQWLVDWIRGGAPASSGEVVNEVTVLGLTTYLACIKNISEDVAKLPFGIYKRLKRGREEIPDHPVTTLLHFQPNDEMTAFSFREVLTSHALGWGNAFAEIVRDGAGHPIELWPLDPTAVQEVRTQDVEKRLIYLVHGVPVPHRNVFHFHPLGYDGLTGYNLPRLVKDPLGNALAAQAFAGAFFGNSTSTSGVIEVPDAMSEPAFKHLRESFFQRYAGSGNQWKPIILEQGAKFNPTSTEPQKSQMIEVFQHSVEEICRLFRMPPHKVQHLLRATFSNIEMQALEYVTDCLLGWVVRWEQEVWRKLLSKEEKRTLYAKHNLEMLLRGDTAARTTFYREMFNIGAVSDNDIREKEDMNPIEGGDTYFVNSALIPLDMAATGEHFKAKQAAEGPKTPEQTPKTPAKPPADDHRIEILGRVAAAHTRLLKDALEALLQSEYDKVSRASKSSDFGAWAAAFYGETHRITIEHRLKPIMEAFDTSVNGILEAAPWN
jgi:HK97 family phage portal protein